MSKAILVMDMPKGCDDCPLRYYNEDIELYKCCVTNRQADWLMGREEKCPLKELPNKIPQFFQNKKCFSDKEKGCFQGWNDCLDEIIGEDDE